MYDEASGKIEMEDIFLEAFKECDIWSGDQYLALHWGWPVDVAKKGGNSFACYDCDKLKSITFPSSVTEIGESAFASCNSLAEINLNEGLKTIKKTAFFGQLF